MTLSVPLAEARTLLDLSTESFLATTRSMDDMALLGHSLCDGWSRLDVVVHVRAGLEEMAAGCAAHTGQPADHDAASYWHSLPDDREADPVAHLLWLRRTAAAYSRPASAVRHLAKAVAAARRALWVVPQGSVIFQGKVLTGGDFLATWVVELAVHELDLDVPEYRADPPGLVLTRRTVETVAEAELPAGLEHRRAVLTALGRVSPRGDERLPATYPIAL